MKPTGKHIFRLAIILFFSFHCTIPTYSQVKHIILVSIDGLRPEMYLDKSWSTPNLRYLMKNGTYADHMKSVFPAYTFPSHTAMITGALPARSKICYNQPTGSKGEWNWDVNLIKVPTLWQAMHNNKLTTAAIMWPGATNGDIDYNLAESWELSTPDDRISKTRKTGTPGLVDEIEINATGKLDSTN
ncbi:MAG: alkaline phosphatase family protein, partial [Chitinophagaceae bacterium]|nr:alkaline phosphatase family protein [Chitinophagaceae bacterium]